MRNLKRVLSLALAAMMVIGMMVVSTSAAEAGDFTDYDEIQYTEAVDVAVALGIIDGLDNGSFGPLGDLTREQAAKIICHMLLGEDNAEKLGTNVSIFKDVAAGRWSAGYIAYCANLDILAGTGEGYFDPEGKLTGVSFAKMLLVILGYDPAVEGYVGANWATEIASDAISAGIDVKGTVLSDVLTREQAVQMVLNTLEADMVYYVDKGMEITTSDGTVIRTGVQGPYADNLGRTGTNYEYNGGDTNNNTDDEDYVQFCEVYFQDDLTKVPQEDSFGRPGDKWFYEGKFVAFAGDKTAAVFTTKTRDAVVANALAGYSVYDVTNDTDRKINNTTKYVGAPNFLTGNIFDRIGVTGLADGALSVGVGGSGETIAKAIADETANGKVLEFYANRQNVITEIVEITYTVGQIHDIDVEDEYTTYALKYSAGGTITGLDSYVDDDLDDEIVIHGEVAKRDWVTWATDDDGVIHVYPTTQIVGTQTAFNTGNETITIDGEVYNVGVGVSDDGSAGNLVAVADFPNTTKDFNYYIDQYGCVVASDAVESTDYAVIDDIVWVTGTGVAGQGYAEARLVFADGSTQVVTVAEMTTTGGITNDFSHADGTGTLATDEATNNHKIDEAVDTNSTFIGRVVTYYVNGDGEYELTDQTDGLVNDTATAANQYLLVKGNAGVTKHDSTLVTTGDNATVYIVKTLTGAGKDKWTAYTGFRNTTDVKSDGADAYVISHVDGNNGYADFVYIDATATVAGSSDVGDMLYVFRNWNNDENDVGGDKEFFLNNVALNGEKVNGLQINQAALSKIASGAAGAGLYEVTTDEKGVITDLEAQDAELTDAYLRTSATADAGDGVIRVTEGAYTVTDDTVVYVVDGVNISVGDHYDVDDTETVYILVEDKNGTAAERKAIDVLYVVNN